MFTFRCFASYCFVLSLCKSEHWHESSTIFNLSSLYEGKRTANRCDKDKDKRTANRCRQANRCREPMPNRERERGRKESLSSVSGSGTAFQPRPPPYIRLHIIEVSFCRKRRLRQFSFTLYSTKGILYTCEYDRY